jgi:poly(3-hydroxyalkanoate) synthetase
MSDVDHFEHTPLPNLKTTHTHLRTLARRQAGNATPTATPTVRERRNVVQCPPGIVDAGVDSVYEIVGSLIRNGVDYWTNLLNRGGSPLDAARDVMDWTKEVNKRERPEWASEHTIVGEWPVARLRDFSGPEEPHDVVPTLILPPQAGHDSCIVDYAPGQSQVQTAVDAGCVRVYSMDWVAATDETKHSTVEDYVETIYQAVTQVGGHVNLVGDCQGGWLATIYAAIHPDTVHTLTIAGAPIDFHAGEPLIHDWLQVTSPIGQMDFYRAAVTANDGVLPGDFLLTGFKLMQPDAEMQRQMALLANIHDKRHVERFRRFEDWFQWTQAIPGAFYLWIVEHLFMNNELLHGTLEVGGKHVDLAEIHCPLYLMAGAKDHITPAPQVFALADFVSTPKDEVTKLTTSGGHLGIFMGHEALRHFWKPVFADIAAQSLIETEHP